MDRRTSIISIFSLGVLGVSSFSVYEWFNYNHKIDFRLLAERKKTIAELAEVIIPRTDTPGAKDAKVEDYILNVLEFCTLPREQHFFLNGLIDLEKYAVDKYNNNFNNCTKSQKIVIVKHFEEKSTYKVAIIDKINKKIIGQPFFSNLKQLTIEGYCQSKVGATQGLAYDYIPGSFSACIPLTKNQRAWATK
ncbi:MAG: gluconate 2-dehydrogenase subunit 3 family protein [Bacteroidota bacterium]